MQFPRVILDVALTSNERAAIMGGQEKPRADGSIRVRVVMTGEKQGMPILVLESAGECDSMGALTWRKEEMPWQIVMSLFVRQIHAAKPLRAERVTAIVEAVTQQMTDRRGGEGYITADRLLAAVDSCFPV